MRNLKWNSGLAFVFVIFGIAGPLNADAGCRSGRCGTGQARQPQYAPGTTARGVPSGGCSAGRSPSGGCRTGQPSAPVSQGSGDGRSGPPAGVKYDDWMNGYFLIKTDGTKVYVRQGVESPVGPDGGRPISQPPVTQPPVSQAPVSPPVAVPVRVPLALPEPEQFGRVKVYTIQTAEEARQFIDGELVGKQKFAIMSSSDKCTNCTTDLKEVWSKLDEDFVIVRIDMGSGKGENVKRDGVKAFYSYVKPGASGFAETTDPLDAPLDTNGNLKLTSHPVYAFFDKDHGRSPVMVRGKLSGSERVRTGQLATLIQGLPGTSPIAKPESKPEAQPVLEKVDTDSSLSELMKELKELRAALQALGGKTEDTKPVPQPQPQAQAQAQNTEKPVAAPQFGSSEIEELRNLLGKVNLPAGRG